MKSNLTRILMTSASLLLLCAAAFAGDGITAVTVENGRKVFLNDSDIPHAVNSHADAHAPRLSGSGITSKYVYWSHTAHRWKPVPFTSTTALRAQTAAAEVLAQTVTDPASSASSTTPPTTESASTFVTSEKVNAAIEAAAARHSVDAELVRAVIKVESNFNPRAVSRKGAMGLMQLMPATARSLRLAHPFDPTENIEAGVRHLRQMLDNFGGDVRMSLAAYNAGATAVKQHNGIPPYRETQAYVRQITALYRNGVEAPGHAPIKVSRDAEGHFVFSNTE